MVQIMVTEHAKRLIDSFRDPNDDLATEKSILFDAMRDGIRAIEPRDKMKFEDMSFIFELQNYCDLIVELSKEKDDPADKE